MQDVQRQPQRRFYRLAADALPVAVKVKAAGDGFLGGAYTQPDRAHGDFRRALCRLSSGSLKIEE